MAVQVEGAENSCHTANTRDHIHRLTSSLLTRGVSITTTKKSTLTQVIIEVFCFIGYFLLMTRDGGILDSLYSSINFTFIILVFMIAFTTECEGIFVCLSSHVIAGCSDESTVQY